MRQPEINRGFGFLWMMTHQSLNVGDPADKVAGEIAFSERIVGRSGRQTKTFFAGSKRFFRPLAFPGRNK